jgi:hypothetical protein
LLDGVLAIKGKWRDGSPLVAVPYYARNNRTTRATPARPGQEGSGAKPGIDYPGGPASLVWIRDE